MELLIQFKTSDEQLMSIAKADLRKYPDSFLSMMTAGHFNGNCQSGVFKVGLDSHTFSLVSQFYTTGTWPNPYIYGNQCTIDGVSRTFENVCTFLGLPSDQIADDSESFDEEDDDHYYDQYSYYDNDDETLEPYDPSIREGNHESEEELDPFDCHICGRYSEICVHEKYGNI
jgi:hypothetical protein